MRLSISRSQESIWVWLFWGIGIYLALEAVPFVVAGLAFKKTVWLLAGPYIAFAVPCVILMPLIWWLRKWEEWGKSPKRLAHGWALSVALFEVAVAIVVFCLGVEFHLMNPMDAVGTFVVIVVIIILIVYFGMYRWTLTTISSRAASKLGNPPPPPLI